MKTLKLSFVRDILYSRIIHKEIKIFITYFEAASTLFVWHIDNCLMWKNFAVEDI